MPVKVKKIASKGMATLVEWNDGTVHRSRVPSALVLMQGDGNEAMVDDPEEGIPYGELWEELVPPISPERVANLLREAGVWTYEDFLHNTAAVNSAFKAACGEIYRDFVQAVHERQSVQQKE